MRLRKRTFLFVMALMMMVIISGCASGASAPTNAPNTANLSTGSTPQVTSTVSSSGNVVVKTATATVGKKSETILTDTNGRTLYYFTSDSLSQVACTTGCIDTWPPLLFKGTGTATAATKLPGDLITDMTSNGNQVAYNGHYLYTYTGDSAPGDVKGDGVGNKWYVATPDLPLNQSGGQPTGY